MYRKHLFQQLQNLYMKSKHPSPTNHHPADTADIAFPAIYLPKCPISHFPTSFTVPMSVFCFTLGHVDCYLDYLNVIHESASHSCISIFFPSLPTAGHLACADSISCHANLLPSFTPISIPFAPTVPAISVAS